MFQVPLLLETVLKTDGERDVLNGDMDEELCHRVREQFLHECYFSCIYFALILDRYRCSKQKNIDST